MVAAATEKIKLLQSGHIGKHRDLAIPIHSKPAGAYQSFLIPRYSAGQRIQEHASTLEAAQAKAAIKQITGGGGRPASLTVVEVADQAAAVRAPGAGRKVHNIGRKCDARQIDSDEVAPSCLPPHGH